MSTTEVEKEATMFAQPQEEHRWLHKLIGEWTYEHACEPGTEPAETLTGTESVRSLGGLWVLAEGQGDMPGGGKAQMIIDGPDFSTPGKMAKYRDVIEFKSDDHRVLTSHLLGDDGEWHQFMTADYRRVR
jgi:hypothetical protein